MTKNQSSQPTDSRLLGLKLHYEYPFFEDLVEPVGALTLDRRSHACWYYTKLAMRSLVAWNGGIDNQQIQYKVGDELNAVYNETRFEEIARSVATVYALESPDEFLKDHWKARVWTQAQQLGLPIDVRIYEVLPGKARLT